MTKGLAPRGPMPLSYYKGHNRAMLSRLLLVWRMRRLSKRAIFVYIALFLLSLLYVVLVPLPTADELLITPRWSRDVASFDATQISENEERGIAFRLANLFGYVTPEGIITYVEEVPFYVAYSDSRFVNYNQGSSEITIRDIYGAPLQNIAQRGYPRLMDERIVVLAANGDTISEWDSSGTLKWQREHHAIISDVALQSNHTLIGLLDGRAILINEDGSLNFEYRDTQPEQQMVIGVALSNDRRFSALASGVNPTHLVVLENRIAAPQEVARLVLPHRIFNLQSLHFLSDNNSLLFERGDTLYYFDTENITLRELRRNVRLLHISHSNCCVAFISSSTTLKQHSGIILQLLHLKLGSMFQLQLPASHQAQPYFISIIDGPPPAILIGFEQSLNYIEGVWE